MAVQIKWTTMQNAVWLANWPIKPTSLYCALRLAIRLCGLTAMVRHFSYWRKYYYIGQKDTIRLPTTRPWLACCSYGQSDITLIKENITTLDRKIQQDSQPQDHHLLVATYNFAHKLTMSQHWSRLLIKSCSNQIRCMATVVNHPWLARSFKLAV